MKQETKQCQNCKNEFVIEPEDFGFYEKIDVPPPTWCPECRAQRRFSWRNEHFVYKRKSDFSGKEIMSMYPKESWVKVYENDVWFSDKWDPMMYGKDVDFSRPFLEQVFELSKDVPVFALSTIRGVNSDYSNNYTGYKNCYLVFNGNYSEDCAYGVGLNNSKDCYDNTRIDKCELSYWGFRLGSCSSALYSSHCQDCYDIVFCKNCVGCSNCFGCVNLRNKQYHIFNKPHSKEEYEKKIREFGIHSYSSLEKMKVTAYEFWEKYPNKYMQELKNKNVSGDYIYYSKNARDSYMVNEAEDVRYCQYLMIGPSKDCYDYTVWGDGAELVYESVASGLGCNNVKFSHECWPEVRDTEYSSYCGSSKNLFGCIGLKKKQYCILNKQYSKESFEKLRGRIIKHMNDMPYVDTRGREYRYGEFFPAEFSPYPYNHSLSQEHFPLSEKEAKQAGYSWINLSERSYKPTKSWKELSETIEEATDDILKEIILCQSWDEDEQEAILHNCTKAFRIIPEEFRFYRKFGIPLPRKCPNSRHAERMKQLNLLGVYHRKCMCEGDTSTNGVYKNATSHFHGKNHCPNKFETSYAPERKEIVYCRECYQSEVI